MATTIFTRLRAMQTEGRPLSDLIEQACDVGDELVAAIRHASEQLESIEGRTKGDSLRLIDRIFSLNAALARAYADNGDTPDNGQKAA